ncbi:MATE family efflux transporter [Treponema sp. OMZ 840]|uniref:MATE family efflux transporter n=1 Tax=Treponema sp. OMZ 840 TaxID=244313 RepID=UPI003D902679
MNKDKLIFIENGDLRKVLLAMGLPMTAGMIVTALYNAADAYFVSGLGNSAFAAVSIVFPLMQIILGIALTFSNGAASYIARLLGAGSIPRAQNTAATAVSFALGSSAAVIAFFLLFLEPVLRFAGASESTLYTAEVYARIIIISGFFTVFNVTAGGILTAQGKPHKTMLMMSTGAALNIILDPIFIYPLGMGVAGAAYATAVSQGLSTLLYTIEINKKDNAVHFSFRYTVCDKEILAQIFKIGFPIFLYQFFASAAIGLTNKAAAPYGDEVISAMGIMLRVTAIGLYIVFGFTKGLLPVIGINYGAGNMQRVKEAVRITNKWGAVFCTAFALILIGTYPFIIKLFSHNASAFLKDTAAKALIYNGIVFIFFAYQSVYCAAFSAMGKAKEGGLLNLSRQGLFFIPLIFILPKLFGLTGLLFVQPAADLCTVLLTKYFLVKNRALFKGTENN